MTFAAPPASPRPRAWHRWLVGLALVTALPTIALLTLDIRAMQSRISAERSVSTGSSRRDTSASQQEQVLLVAPADASPRTAALTRSVVETLRAEVGFGTVIALDAPTERADHPLLVVAIQEQSVRWTPVYAVARIVVTASFASTGDVRWRHQQPPTMELEGPGELMVDGTVTLRDQSYGLIARPAYRRHLEQALGAALVDALEQPLAGRS
jgi:hypothetical protein